MFRGAVCTQRHQKPKAARIMQAALLLGTVASHDDHGSMQ